MSQIPEAKKSLGQHWLHDPDSLEAICDAGGVSRGDTVLEIGPGTGELTARLLARDASVIALELDSSLISSLNSRFLNHLGDRLTIEQGDIRTYNLTNLPPDYKIVANIPYYLSSHLLRLLGEADNRPKRAALLVQKEVAERVAADPGDMSVVSVMTQLHYEVSKGWLVPAHLFTPPPKVDSQVLILQRRDRPLFKDLDDKAFARVVKAGFSARRKTLHNSLAGSLRKPKDEVAQLLSRAGIDPNTRPQELSLQQWHKLTQLLSEK